MVSPEWAFARTTSAGTVKVHANGAQSAEGNQELFVHAQGGRTLEDRTVLLLHHQPATQAVSERQAEKQAGQSDTTGQRRRSSRVLRCGADKLGGGSMVAWLVGVSFVDL